MGGKPKVLIVDDEPDVLLTLRILLEGEGFEPSLAAEGETALRRIDNEQPDLLLLDIMMPVLDGWMVLAQLADRPHRPKVVVCSAKTGELDIARAKELGAAAYITKPFDPMDLIATLREVLADRKSGQFGAVATDSGTTDDAAHDDAGHDGAGHDDAGHDDAGHDDAAHDDATHVVGDVAPRTP